MGLVEFGNLLERVLACDVGVQNEEGFVVLGQDFLGELKRTGGTERFGLKGEMDLDT